jgi:MYXO-CTERM domain-containing protein
MNYNKKIASLGIGCLLAVASTHTYAQVITQWTFDNDTVAVNNSPAPSTGSGTADSIGMATYPTPNVGVTTDDVLLGVTSGSKSDTGANGVADGTNEWRVRAQAGPNGAANGWSSAAPIGTQGAQFFAPTTSVTSGAINVSFDWYATTQGEANMQLEYTTNGGTTWNNVALTLGGSDAGLQVLSNNGLTDTNTVTGSYVSDNLLNSTKAGQDWFTGLTATINDPNALNDSGFGIEMVNASTGTDDISTQGTALNNSSGNWRFDNVTISGVAAAPEPGSWALALIVALAFVGLRRSSRHSV